MLLLFLDLSNWMCYVRPAKNVKEQNLVISQIGKSLFYTTTRSICAKEELKVWYSIPYAAARSLPLLLDTNNVTSRYSYIIIIYNKYLLFDF